MAFKQAAIAISLFLFFGTMATFAYKLQNSVTVNQGGHQKKFFHPYMQCFTMFAGEALCLLIFLKYRKQNNTPLEKGKTPHKPWIFFIPAFADGCATTLGYMGLCFIQGSTWMMFKGACIVWTAIFSKMLMKTVLQKRHYAGCTMAVIGVVIVGSSVFLEPTTQDSQAHDKKFIGYALMTISLVFNGFFYAYEQYLFTKHSINPTEMVGYEGIFGMITTFIVASTLSYIPCSFNPNNCVFSNAGESFIELPGVFFNEIFGHIQLLILVVGGLLAIGIYNYNGLRITKMFDALTRALLNITKTSLIWIVGIFITLSAGGNKDYQIQSLNIGVNMVKCVGFVIIILGTLTYNKLIFNQLFEYKKQKDDVQFKQINEEQQS